MSVNVVSLGEYDFSIFDLNPLEQIIISNIIKFDICSYSVSKNLQNEIVFFSNSTSLSQEHALKLFSYLFDLLETHHSFEKINHYYITILNFSFEFKRELENNIISWKININHLDKLKNELFHFYFKSSFYHQLNTKLPQKNLPSKLEKI